MPEKPSEMLHDEERMAQPQGNLIQEGTKEVRWPNTKNPSRFVQKNHSEELIIGDKNVGMETRRKLLTGDTKQVHLSLFY